MPRDRGRRTPVRPRPKPRATTQTAIPQVYTPAVPAPAASVPAGPGISWQPPTMTPALQALYEQQVTPTGTVAGPGMTPFGGAVTPSPYTPQAQALREAQKWEYTGPAMLDIQKQLALQKAKTFEYKGPTLGEVKAANPWLGTDWYKPPKASGGGGGYYRPTRGRSYGTRRGVSQTRRTGLGLFNWRIGL